MRDRDMRRKEIGLRLKAAAKEVGKAAEDVAADLGISAQTVYGWWRGDRQPDLLDLEAYAEATNREPGWFYDPEGRRKRSAEDMVVDILALAMNGVDFGEAHDAIMGNGARLSPRDRRMVSAGTAALRTYINQQEDWASLTPEERLRLLRRVVEMAHREE